MTIRRDMHLGIRSQLRALLTIWAISSITCVAGYCAATGIVAFGIYEGVKKFSSDVPFLWIVGPLALGCGLQILLAHLAVGIRERFEDRCWELVEGSGGTSFQTTEEAVLARQVDGKDASLGAIRARRSQKFSKRVLLLMEYAWAQKRGQSRY